MILNDQNIEDANKSALSDHQKQYDNLKSTLSDKHDLDAIIQKLKDFQVAIPSWALGTGGTRFGRYGGGGEPRTLEEKMYDVGLIHKLNQNSGAISLHIPWDIPENPEAIRQLASNLNLKFDAVNSNTFQDQEDAKYSYKYGSLSHVDAAVRQQAIDHNKEVIDYGKDLGSKSLTVWLADGSSHPGQNNFRKAFERTYESLQEIYNHLPADWKVFIEYKPYEPYFYSMVIQDWGTSHLLAQKLGDKALSLVDLGHHLPNTNIEQIVATLMMQNKLGGFHFNDSKFGDDDLTVGSLKPYQLFLIFNELVDGMLNTSNPDLSWMIDASHNMKDPLEDLLQSVDAILLAYAQALVVDRKALDQAQESNDITGAQEILQNAYRMDLRPLLAEARRQAGAALNPIKAYRQFKVRDQLIDERGLKTISTGL
ncbi:putative sugar isomerase [Owenweeksia hongkongensis DSM 17368]|uniref:Putative sugar isomerase n=1 Tax=Owenweeksia hongkongensis (strain DSM 17368 / CIP 108786 / JCM 12287 / NRRL B-23963 / UST20020801) TaxID=926562 RepID=G8R315_OWEHD|nr:TIM barrel protein [Owenweeksia hongkongensis]AEV33009.1 putative sugar isomerase [Owenweeksia hongkongensis DSM 17368]